MEARITGSTLIALGGLVGVVALLFLAITRYRWHVFIALLGPILLFALLPGIDRAVFINAFEVGFGKTVQSIAVVIVVGTILAEGLKHTGGIERITISMIRWVGEKRMPLALTLSGWVIGIPIFSDVGYVILNPLVHSAAIRAGLNMSVMSTGLIGAMQLTHAMVPPTPGPLAAVAILHADMGRVIVYGCFVSIIASVFGWLYAMVVGPRLESPPSVEFVGQSFVERGREADLPTTFWAFAPILIPLVLIAAQSTAAMTLPKTHIVNEALLYLGWPVVALSIGVLIAYRNTKRDQAGARTSDWIENGRRAESDPAADAGGGRDRDGDEIDGTAGDLPAVRVRRGRQHDHRVYDGGSDHVGVDRRADDGDARPESRGDDAGSVRGRDHHEVRELELFLGVHVADANAAAVSADLVRWGDDRERRGVDGGDLRVVDLQDHLMCSSAVRRSFD